jgi:hypothetical protein
MDGPFAMVGPMDILAHGLWAAAGGEVLRRRGRMTKQGLAACVLLGVAPDLLQYLPVLAGVLVGQVSAADVLAYALADPGREPPLRDWVNHFAHHLHCIMHSAVIAGAVTLLSVWWRPAFVYPLLGWWLHIGTDVPTHSAEYYAVPVLYPFTYRGFDGIAWTSPAFMVMNYVAIVVVAGWLYRTRRPGSMSQP